MDSVIKWRWIWVALLALALTGCATKLLYRNLDWFIVEYIDDYVSLDREQQKIVKLQLKKLIDWHQKNELSQYIAQIEELSTLSLPSLTDEDLIYHADQMTNHIYRLAQRVAPDIYALSQLASDEQLSEFLDNYEQKGEERQKDYAAKDAQQRFEDSLETMTESVERWFGSVNEQQLLILEEWAMNRIDTRPLWHRHRVSMGDKMKTMFARRYDLISYQNQMMAMLTEPDSFYSVELDDKLEQSRVLNREYLLRLAHLSTVKQQQHFKDELSEWTSILNNLSEE
ncbi:hypothetical protein ST37_02165 (plasmid) [Vibrio sp. qd031]|uniref:DUF6279 family lipoprotein n=1 Tax=Vibrio sp. qd031 TaxID=1603038 RepID=UPI000A11DEFA|nr:DUF6279 family lipoprotein [Vibrio sp. qd031]ORT52589.1 hypothetical protein ST37_02165 [Vibrio sp. qd031]